MLGRFSRLTQLLICGAGARSFARAARASLLSTAFLASLAWANPNPQPSTYSMPVTTNGDPSTGAAALVCPMGPPGVPVACSGQVTVRAQSVNVGYVDWRMVQAPILSSVGGTFSYDTGAGYTCAAVPGNSSGAEPSDANGNGGGYCTLTGFMFTPAAAYAGAAASLTISINWEEQSPDDVNSVQYTVNDPPLAGTVNLTVTTLAYGTAAVASNLVTCPATPQTLSNSCGTITVTAQGGLVQIPTSGFIAASDTQNFSTLDAGTCTPGLVLQSGSSCATGTLTFKPVSVGNLTDTVTLAPIEVAPTTLTFSGTGLSGSPTASPATITCLQTAVGQTSQCSAGTLGAVGLTTLTANAVTIADTANFSVGQGTCAAGALAPGSYCQTGEVSFHPTSGVAHTTQLAIQTNWGASTINVVTPTSWGSPAFSGALNCGSVGKAVTQACGTVEMTAVGGPLTINSISMADSANYSISSGTCLAGSVLPSGQSCTTGQVLFTPTAALSLPTSVNFSLDAGLSQVAVSGTGIYGVPTPSQTSLDCGIEGAGVTKNCGTITLTAVGGEITLSADASIADATNYAMSPGTCLAGTSLLAGASCTTGAVFFTPSVGGQTYPTELSLPADAGLTAVALTGTGIVIDPPGAASAAPATLPCGIVEAGMSAPCGALSVSAVGGSVVLNAFSLADTTNFSGPALSACDASNSSATACYSVDNTTNLTCAAGMVLNSGSSCTSGTFTFNPQVVAWTLSSAVSLGCTAQSGCNTPTVVLSGSSYPQLVASIPAVTCAPTIPGQTSTCLQTVTFTAMGGSVQLQSNPLLVSSSLTSFTTPSPISLFKVSGCNANATLSLGQSCTVTSTYSPLSVQSTPDTATVTANTVDPQSSANFTLTATSATGPYQITMSSQPVACASTLNTAVTCALITANAQPTGHNGYIQNILIEGAGFSSSNSTNCTYQGTCTFTAIFDPSQAGTSVGVYTAIGYDYSTGSNTAASLSLSGETINNPGDTAGTLVASTPSITCQNVQVGSGWQQTPPVCTQSVTLSAVGGYVQFAPVPFTSSDAHFAAYGNTCATPGQLLGPGEYCTVSTTFSPIAAETYSSTISANTVVGTGTAYTVSGTGFNGPWIITAVPQPAGCATPVGTSTTCTLVTVTTTQTGYYTYISDIEVAGAGFSIPAGACQYQQTCTFPLTFAPTVSGTATATLSVLAYSTSGQGDTSTLLTVIGQTPAPADTPGTLVTSVPGITCSDLEVGATETCTSTVTLTAVGGDVQFSPVALTSSDPHFSAAGSTCATPNAYLGVGDSCQVSVTFSPTAIVPYATVITADTAIGTGVAFTVNGNGLVGPWSIKATPQPAGCAADLGTSTTCTLVTVDTTEAGAYTYIAGIELLSGPGFSIPAGACLYQSICTFPLTFAPTTPGNSVATISARAYTNSGQGETALTFTVLGEVPSAADAVGRLVFSAPSVSCADLQVGGTETCSSTVTMTAVGGDVVFTQTPLTSNDRHFSATGSTCATPGSTMGIGDSCIVSTTFAPTALLAYSATITANTVEGASASYAVTGTGVVGPWTVTATAQPAGCATEIGSTTTCALVTIDTTEAGAYTYIAGIELLSGAGFSIPPGACLYQTICTFPVTFAPTAAGDVTATLSVLAYTNSGQGDTARTFTILGQVPNSTSTAGILTASVPSIACASLQVGGTETCTSTVTLTAVGGYVAFTQKPLSSSDAHFTAVGSTCATAGSFLGQGDSCVVSTTFSPTAILAYSSTITANTEVGAGTSFNVTGTGLVGPWTITAVPQPAGCATSVGSTVTCTMVTINTTEAGAYTYVAGVELVSGAGFSIPAGACLYQPTCTFPLTFAPTVAGDSTATISVLAYSNSGQGDTAVTFTVLGQVPSSTSTPGSLTADVSGVTCPSLQVGATETCTGTVTLTAVGGDVVFSQTPLTSSDSHFSATGSTCATPGSYLGVGDTCVVTTSFSPQGIFDYTTTISANVSVGSGVTYTAAGTGLVGPWTISATATPTSCTAAAGASVTCATVAIDVTQSGQYTYIQSLQLTGAGFSIPQGACAYQQTCSVVVTFAPTVDGVVPATLSILAYSGTGDTAKTVTITGTATSLYHWLASGYGACSGGQGTWVYGAWTPSTGCGVVTQTTTGTCTATANSGTQSQTVTCTDGSGNVVANALCATDGTMPALTHACNDTGTPTCGTEGPLTQSVTLSNTCIITGGGGTGGTGTGGDGSGGTGTGGTGSGSTTPTYSWTTCSASSCTGGSGTWTLGSWLSAIPSGSPGSCDQTNTPSCTVTPNSGSCTPTCQDSSGNAVAASNCGTAPVTTCTPTSVTCSAGNKPASTRVDPSCSYTWTDGAYGACLGGTGTWDQSSSVCTPLTGCGATPVSCIGTSCNNTAGSGKETEVATCVRSDGTAAVDSFCGATPPTKSIACTATGNAACGVSSFNTTLTYTQCDLQNTSSGPCTADPAAGQFCVIIPLNNSSTH